MLCRVACSGVLIRVLHSDFANCNSILNQFMRKFGGVWGLVGAICLLTGIIIFCGYFGFKQYKKRKEALNFSVINDDSIYKE